MTKKERKVYERQLAYVNANKPEYYMVVLDHEFPGKYLDKHYIYNVLSGRSTSAEVVSDFLTVIKNKKINRKKLAKMRRLT